MPRKLAAILYADVAGYSRLTGEDEEGTHRRLSEYLDLISALIDQHNGGVVHYAGDAVLADFGTASDSLTCAVAIQRDLASRNETLPDDRKLHFRVGVNLGEVIVDRNDIYGDGVNVAARLESLARPGGICISDAVRSAIGNKLAFEYEFNHNGGTTTNRRAFYMQGMFENCLYRFNGGEINSESMHPVSGYSYWHMGGTMEIAADSTVNASSGVAVIAQGFFKGYSAPILKFTGTDTKLTMNADVDFLSPLDPGNTIPAQLDVNEFTVSAANTWVTVMDANSITNGDQLAFIPGTDANVWQMQVVGDLVQVKYTGDVGRIMGDVDLSGFVDDDDLSLLLANWNTDKVWEFGNLSDPYGTVGYVDDDDLSLLLANWGAGSSAAPEAVPEPLTLSLLVMGGCGLILRRRK